MSWYITLKRQTVPNHCYSKFGKKKGRLQNWSSYFIYFQIQYCPVEQNSMPNVILNRYYDSIIVWHYDSIWQYIDSIYHSPSCCNYSYWQSQSISAARPVFVYSWWIASKLLQADFITCNLIDNYWVIRQLCSDD